MVVVAPPRKKVVAAAVGTTSRITTTTKKEKDWFRILGIIILKVNIQGRLGGGISFPSGGLRCAIECRDEKIHAEVVVVTDQRVDEMIFSHCAFLR